ncbi:hypothetical protein BH09BAC3_BH09BAC3_16620 [soil metagenome]
MGYLSGKTKINDDTQIPGMTEVFKGIEFVRISALPQDQKDKIWKSFSQDKIIKIAKDEAVLVDCILYQDYLSWVSQPDSDLPLASHKQSKPLRTLLLREFFQNWH